MVIPPQISQTPGQTVKVTYLEIGQEELLVELASFDGGGFSDVFRATWKHSKDSQVVVKRFRGLHTLAENAGGEEQIKKMEKRLRIEVETWKRAESHPNILPFIGLYQETNVLLPSLVSPYRPDRDIMRFVRIGEPDCDRRILALHIAKGVAHLHSLNIIHGDLKPHNVLVHRDENNAPIAQITDFGRAKIVNERGYTGSLHHTIRYTSPEVIGIAIPGEKAQNAVEDPSNANRVLSFHSDTYGMGMTILEVLSNEPPYPLTKQNDYGVYFALMNGVGPTLAHNESPKFPMLWVWNVLTKCWMVGASPEKRIPAGEFVVKYEKVMDIKEE